MKNKRGQISIAITTGLILAVALIVGLLAIFGISVMAFLVSNVYTLIGATILILSLVIGLPVVFKGGANQYAFTILLIFILVGVSLMFLPKMSNVIGFSVGGSLNDWTETDQTCSIVDDCINFAVDQGFTEEYIRDNIQHIKCEEVCYFEE